MRIIGDGSYTEILYWSELTDLEREELSDNYKDIHTSAFFRYNNNIFDLNDFLRISDFTSPGMKDDFGQYHGIYNMSAFDGILIKINEDGDYIQAYYYMI